MNRERYYAAQADKEAGHDHEVAVAYKDRLTVSEGAFGRAWMKFNPGVKLVYVDDAEGRPRGLTPKQYQVLVLALDCIDRRNPTMRSMALELEVAASTISRAPTKLAAWGLIGYLVGRGRYAGMVIFRRIPNDGFDRLRVAAKARVRRWSEALRRRISRLEINVAPYILEKERGVDSLYYYLYSLDTSKGATLTAQLKKDWTPQELREAGII